MALGHRRLIAALAVTIIVLAVAARLVASHQPPVTGRVIDLTGDPVAGASISMGDRTTRSRADGTFVLTDPPREAWIRADARGYLPRLKPSAAGRTVLLRLTPDDGKTISLVFGGDVMFGRRFFDPNEDGDPRDGQLGPNSTAADHAALLSGVQASLQAADLSIINLETPLLPNPYINPTQSRPSGIHPTKEFVFASEPISAKAIDQVGIDVVGLGNNHVYDGLESGVRQTLDALDAAGFNSGSRRTGAGVDSASAWIPAIRTVRGVTVAVLACTTIDGHETPPLYVATTSKGGAAECTDDGIRTAVTAARARALVVVMMIHGGFEYVRSPSDRIHHLSKVAHDAGATLVVNHHPHVIGGFQFDETGLTAWTIGNLLFDQTVWPTFESYLVTVHVRGGRPIRAMVDPLIVDDFRPEPIIGDLADHVAHDAAGWEPGPFVIEDGSVEIQSATSISTKHRSFHMSGACDGSIVRLQGATRLELGGISGSVETGRDLLWTGGFEDEEIDGRMRGPPLWQTGGRGRDVLQDAAATGGAGIQLERTGANVEDVVLGPDHRIPVDAGSSLSFLAMVKGLSSDVAAHVQLSWYNDLKGGSSQQTRVDIPAADGWNPVRIDATVPRNAVAVLPLIRLGPPAAGQALLDVDDVRLIEWRPAGDATLATDYLRITDSAAFSLGLDTLPGSDETIAKPMPIPDAGAEPAPRVPDLPPGPSRNPVGDD
jgi:poly-gamma-glutamate capsule biosynthesis protein CapA/YwtB (metallophosphatase superfamily)